MEGFKSLINYNPLEYKFLKPEEKKLDNKNNPPKLIVEFFDEQKNLQNINCYSNDGGKWKKSNLQFEKKIDFGLPPSRGPLEFSTTPIGLTNQKLCLIH